jgi:hypothetical protein
MELSSAADAPVLIVGAAAGAVMLHIATSSRRSPGPINGTGQVPQPGACATPGCVLFNRFWCLRTNPLSDEGGYLLDQLGGCLR